MNGSAERVRGPLIPIGLRTWPGKSCDHRGTFRARHVDDASNDHRCGSPRDFDVSDTK